MKKLTKYKVENEILNVNKGPVLAQYNVGYKN